MYGDKYPFRKQFIGGFNQKDVVAFIRKMAEDRQVLREAIDEANCEIQKLSAKVQELNVELYARTMVTDARCRHGFDGKAHDIDRQREV